MINKRLLESEILILIVVAVFFIVGYSLDTVALIEPKGNIEDIRPEFVWYSNYDMYRLIVDDDLEFNNPIIDIHVKEEYYEVNRDLDFGKYYWKVIGYEDGEEMKSAVGIFSIQSLVQLRVGEDEIENSGNTPVNLKMKKKEGGAWSIVGAVVLDINEKIITENDTLYEAEQNG